MFGKSNLRTIIHAILRGDNRIKGIAITIVVLVIIHDPIFS